VTVSAAAALDGLARTDDLAPKAADLRRLRRPAMTVLIGEQTVASKRRKGRPMTTPEVDGPAAPATMPVLRFFDFEGLVELLETATLPFERWLDASDDAAGFLYRRLPDALIHAAAAPVPPRRGRLERWWARKEREGEMETVLDLIRSFRLPALAWVDRWHADAPDNAALWQVHAAAGRTIALRSTLGRLATAIVPGEGRTLAVQPVTYDPAGAAGAAAGPSILRSPGERAWEQEVRAVLRCDAPVVDVASATLAVGVDLPALAESIILADGTPERRQTLIRNVLARYGLDLPCGRPLTPLPAPLPLPMVIEQS
jgi:hypothetical protein